MSLFILLVPVTAAFLVALVNLGKWYIFRVLMKKIAGGTYDFIN